MEDAWGISGEPLAAFLLEAALGQSGLAALVPVMDLGRGPQKASPGTKTGLIQRMCVTLGSPFSTPGSLSFPMWYCGRTARPCLWLALHFTIWVALGQCESLSLGSYP